MEIRLKELIKAYPKAVIIDFKRKEATIIKNGKMKVYNKNYFNEIIIKMGVQFENNQEV